MKGEATVNATVDERDSDMGGGAVFHDNRVEIERHDRAPDPPGAPPSADGVSQAAGAGCRRPTDVKS